jgi:hypothetical protein
LQEIGARSVNVGEKRWVILAIVIIVIGVTVGILHQLGYVPLWVSTTSTVLMGIAAISAAIIATRASNRNDHHG